jgi:hypothetical protein
MHTHIPYARMSNAQVVYDRRKALGNLRVYVRASLGLTCLDFLCVPLCLVCGYVDGASWGILGGGERESLLGANGGEREFIRN